MIMQPYIDITLKRTTQKNLQDAERISQSKDIPQQLENKRIADVHLLL